MMPDKNTADEQAAIKANILAGVSYNVPLDPELPPDAVDAIVNEIANDIGLDHLHAEVGDNEVVFSLRPPETEPQAEGETMITLHDAILELRARTSKPVRLICIPRELSLRLVGERAEKHKKNLPLAYITALRNPRLRTQLIVIDGTPVLALPMMAPMITVYYGTNDGTTLSAVEEHPAYSGLPFSKRLADTQPERMSNFGRNALLAAIQASDAAADAWVSALPFMPASPPDPTPSTDDPPQAPKTDAEFFAKVRSGLLQHKAEINDAIRVDSQYLIKLGRASRMTAQVKELLEDTLNVLVTVSAPDEHDYSIFTLTQRLLVS